MPQQKPERNYFDKHSSSPNPKPFKEVEYGANKVYDPLLNKININLANRPEH